MFCRFCGKTIPDEAVFCHLCGKDQQIAPQKETPQPNQTQEAQQAQPAQTEPQYQPPVQPIPPVQPVNTPPYTPAGRNNDPSQYPVLYSASGNQKLLKKATPLIIMFSILLGVMQIASVFFIVEGIRSKFDSTDFIIILFYEAICAGLIYVIVINIIQTKLLKATKLNITEAGIFGMGSTRKYCVRKEFNFDYNQIERVNNLLDTHALLDVGNVTYAFAVDNANDYADKIKELHAAYREKYGK